MTALRVEHVYVHVPFCARRCTYCDFSIAVRRSVPWRAFAEAVDAEWRVRDLVGTTAPLRGLYLGGGTPSHLGGEGVAALLDTLRQHVVLRADTEVTIEANPEDITPAALRAWRAAGANRLSIGVQSFDDRVLAWMHRVHDATAARVAVQAARDAGFDNLSVDLIFALPDGITRDWDRDVNEALALRVEHVSLYGLTVEPQTPLGRQAQRGAIDVADDERYAGEFLRAHDALTAAGFEHYEVSNFGLPGRRAVHNGAYWRGVPYLGLGPSAHGFDGAIRRWNTAAYAAWHDAVAAGRDPVAGQETLDAGNRLAEAVYLGLRTSDGLAVDARDLQHVQRWIDAGWVRVQSANGDLRLVCTAHGWLRLDALAADLTAFRSGS